MQCVQHFGHSDRRPVGGEQQCVGERRVGHQSADLGAGQTAEFDVDGAPDVPEKGGGSTVRFDLFRSVGQHHRRPLAAIGNRCEELNAAVVGPLEIVHDEQDAGHGCHHPGDTVDRQGASAFRVDGPIAAVGQFRDDGADRRTQGPGSVSAAAMSTSRIPATMSRASDHGSARCGQNARTDTTGTVVASWARSRDFPAPDCPATTRRRCRRCPARRGVDAVRRPARRSGAVRRARVTACSMTPLRVGRCRGAAAPALRSPRPMGRVPVLRRGSADTTRSAGVRRHGRPRPPVRGPARAPRIPAAARPRRHPTRSRRPVQPRRRRRRVPPSAPEAVAAHGERCPGTARPTRRNGPRRADHRDRSGRAACPAVSAARPPRLRHSRSAARNSLGVDGAEGVRGERVSARTGDDQTGRSDGATRPVDQDLEIGRWVPGRPVGPEHVDDDIGRDEATAAGGQEAKQRPDLSSAEFRGGDLHPVAGDDESTHQTQLDGRPGVVGTSHPLIMANR